MTENGIIAYDLAGNWCEECGRAKSFRLFPGALTGCLMCDEVITRHRCTKRPDRAGVTAGTTWACPDCGTAWIAAEREEPCPDCCGGCGHMVTAARWDVGAVDAGRIAAAPRYKPEPWTPFRNPFPQPRRFSPPPLPKECHRTPGGIMIHVKPGCRCRR